MKNTVVPRATVQLKPVVGIEKRRAASLQPQRRSKVASPKRIRAEPGWQAVLPDVSALSAAQAVTRRARVGRMGRNSVRRTLQRTKHRKARKTR